MKFLILIALALCGCKHDRCMAKVCARTDGFPHAKSLGNGSVIVCYDNDGKAVTHVAPQCFFP